MDLDVSGQASRHHLAALTAAGQVWIWRFKHGNIHTQCNKWEHISILDDKSIILVDISGPDVDRASAGYEAEQEDQVFLNLCRRGIGYCNALQILGNS